MSHLQHQILQSKILVSTYNTRPGQYSNYCIEKNISYHIIHNNRQSYILLQYFLVYYVILLLWYICKSSICWMRVLSSHVGPCAAPTWRTEQHWSVSSVAGEAASEADAAKLLSKVTSPRQQSTSTDTSAAAQAAWETVRSCWKSDEEKKLRSRVRVLIAVCCLTM